MINLSKVNRITILLIILFFMLTSIFPIKAVELYNYLAPGVPNHATCGALVQSKNPSKAFFQTQGSIKEGDIGELLIILNPSISGTPKNLTFTITYTPALAEIIGIGINKKLCVVKNGSTLVTHIQGRLSFNISTENCTFNSLNRGKNIIVAKIKYKAKKKGTLEWKLKNGILQTGNLVAEIIGSPNLKKIRIYARISPTPTLIPTTSVGAEEIKSYLFLVAISVLIILVFHKVKSVLLSSKRVVYE